MPASRRDVLKFAAAAAAWTAGLGDMAGAAPATRRSYGAAVTHDDLIAEPRLGEAIVKYCSQIVPAYELKWATLRPTRDKFDFTGADLLLAFARRHRLAMRGHNLVWYAALPDWTREIASAAEAERELLRHIETVASRYRGWLTSWDVVNEPIPDNVERDTDRRECVWSRFLGQRYIDLAFRAAAAADPHARLVLNEYDVEFADGRFPTKRAALRRLALELLDAGAPLHAIGMQCHLRGAESIYSDGVARFVEEMRWNGLDVYVTELDVIDRDLPGDVATRDAIVARQAEAVLSAINAGAPLNNVLTWGLSDRFTWMSKMLPRPDGLPNRPLPLDADFTPKPFMAMLEKFTRAAA